MELLVKHVYILGESGLPFLSNIIFRYKGKKFDTEYTPTIYEELPQVVEYKESTVYL